MKAAFLQSLDNEQLEELQFSYQEICYCHELSDSGEKAADNVCEDGALWNVVMCVSRQGLHTSQFCRFLEAVIAGKCISCHNFSIASAMLFKATSVKCHCTRSSSTK